MKDLFTQLIRIVTFAYNICIVTQVALCFYVISCFSGSSPAASVELRRALYTVCAFEFIDLIQNRLLIDSPLRNRLLCINSSTPRSAKASVGFHFLCCISALVDHVSIVALHTLSCSPTVAVLDVLIHCSPKCSIKSFH